MCGFVSELSLSVCQKPMMKIDRVSNSIGRLKGVCTKLHDSPFYCVSLASYSEHFKAQVTLLSNFCWD